MNINLADKMKHFQTSIFNELSSYKREKMSEGVDMIDLSVGSPDLPPAQFVIDELTKQVQDPKQYGYTLTGTDELHQAIATFYGSQYNVPVEAKQEALMVMGSQDGLVHLPMVLTNPGDTILLPDPGYTAYHTGIALAEAEPYFMPLKEENHFLPDLDAIPREILQKSKMMILNFPGNPVPAVATKEFFEKVVTVAKKYNIAVLHDFAYSELYYDEKPISFLSIEGAKEVGVEFNSFSKSFNLAGCRIGYIVGNEAIVDGLKQLKSNLDFGVFLPIQKTAIRALENATEFTQTLRSIYKARRDLLVSGLHKAGWEVASPKASMFIWAKVPESYTSTEFTYQLMDEAGIVVVPGNAFGPAGEGYVRIGLVQPEEVLEKAVQRLKNSNLFAVKTNSSFV
ncbi:LL-diaminopimelate aminotransferase [Virgibacillus pantothenticus]|uniref:LL-diaminopimelate aminotransferase n=1 Tax=Virgibacillus pantothenticus TaxID=1473 RepID=UPI001C2141DF|nr:LL-diaminopimelate aminotransferase [Virgibacillus pantothenticus]MBU8565778.1 LL-diaminopimelate aminotransferase [Virgibacillus pantothenticus]MBU8599635.1 LL-diaminopimelate aminotransferase [Virgibacillus pantothenticus]MBU8634082.1 LL-diaminopimelate aminotransferase [Virgibacillus pantothenticus]MBU8642123.1 LL-diaminopimelate aminotransferase [Virgibacillus pantothenticus]MBU8645894.1 LL-diaminopimelate aminotransferase [Virgibacillus pantothenticus]